MHRWLLAFVILALPFSVHAAEPIRVGVLQYGTVNWELKSMKNKGFDTRHGVDVDIVPFAGENATSVALQAGAVDIIVSDWLLVSRQRSRGQNLTFSPYSTATGALMVSADSPLQSLADLHGQRIGVAGGPLDKSWLLIQGLASRDHGLDLAAENDIVYGSPPLLTEKARQGELDGVLNYWHYAARLEAEGFRRLISAEDAANALGAVGPVSFLGYVFRERWARAHPEAIAGFLAASRDTKAYLKASDEQWLRLRDIGAIRDDGKALKFLRDRYREGIPARSIADERADAAHIYGILAELGGAELVGSSETLMPGTFWQAPRDEH